MPNCRAMAYPPAAGDRNVIDCTMFTNTPDSIMVRLPGFLLAPGGGFFTRTNSV
ncbi:hypothetical protein [uncultured Nostoc sp.]|uniref:hypothetical protein n=1 Tax=uncultured Nostoc sp. TaxID=340711 RepID=UPI0035CC0688